MAMIFRKTDPWPGAGQFARRSLSHSRLDARQVLAVEGAVKALKLECKRPYWQRDAWAHIGIPKLKVAITAKICSTAEFARRQELAWGEYGWLHLTVDVRSIAGMQQEDLTEHLRQALVESGRLKA